MRRLIVQRVRAELWPVRQVASAAVVSAPGGRDLVVT